jgi:quaternary ammonium compound-resistance protein SugE
MAFAVVTGSISRPNRSLLQPNRKTLVMSEMTDLHLNCVTPGLKSHDSASPPSTATVLASAPSSLGAVASIGRQLPDADRLVLIHIADTRLRYAPAMSDAIAGWVTLLLAGAFEIAWAYSLKHADGFTRFWPSVATVVAIGLSFAFMVIALRSIPFGTAYAVWCGIGVAGTATVGIIAFGEPTTSLRLVCLALIATGIVGLKLTSH